MNNITVTSRMERKIHCVQIELNINSLQTLYDNKELKFTKYFKIDNIPISFTVWDSDYSQISNPPSVQKSLHLDVYDENVEEIECDFQEVTVKMENLIGTIKPKDGASHLSFWKNPSYPKSDKQIIYDLGAITNLKKKKSSVLGNKLVEVSGTFSLRIKVGEAYMRKERLIQEYSALNTSSTIDDLEIICEDEEKVLLNKNLLCKISDVFSTMLKNPNTLESKNSSIKLENVSSSTMISFKNMLTKDVIESKDLTAEMLVFADQYNIQPLVKVCQVNLKKSVSKENFMDIVKAADVINDKELLQAAADFAALNIGTFNKDPEIKDFIKSNPECFANVWEMMMFK